MFRSFLNALTNKHTHTRTILPVLFLLLHLCLEGCPAGEGVPDLDPALLAVQAATLHHVVGQGAPTVILSFNSLKKKQVLRGSTDL